MGINVTLKVLVIIKGDLSLQILITDSCIDSYIKVIIPDVHTDSTLKVLCYLCVCVCVNFTLNALSH